MNLMQMKSESANMATDIVAVLSGLSDDYSGLLNKIIHF